MTALREAGKGGGEVSGNDLFGEKLESDRKRMARLRAEIEAPFVRNQHGLWCPQCGELIADWEWIGDCDACGYPSEIEDDCIFDGGDDW